MMTTQQIIRNFMIRYFKNSKSLTLLLSLFILSCTSIDDNLGANLIPPADKLKIENDTLYSGFKIRSIQVDSMLSDNSASFYLGSAVLPRQGRIDASFMTQVVVGTLPDAGVFPAEAVVDSAYMIVSQNGYIGQEGYDLTMSVYELTKPLPNPKDSSYYTNFPIKDYIPAVPDIVQTITSSKSLYVKLKPSFVEKYLKATKEQNKDSKLFNEVFFGYYFKTNSTFGAGSLYNVDPNTSGIKIYYRDSPDSKATKSYILSFSHIIKNKSTGTEQLISEGFSFFDRDYSFTDPVFGFDPTSTTKSYVMGLVGYVTELDIPKEFVDKIAQILAANPNNIVGILRAELIVPIADRSISAMNDAIPSLGLYYNYQAFKYMPSYTAQNQAGLGGGLNRAKGEYSFNVTAYIQDLIRNKRDKYTIQVAPKIGNGFTFGGTELMNTPERPIKLIISYTTNK